MTYKNQYPTDSHFKTLNIPKWKEKKCSYCEKIFKTTKNNKHCCSSTCHKALMKQQKEKRLRK
jgi:hypothetical protein